MTHKPNKTAREEFEEVLKEWMHFEDIYDNNMAEAGIEPPLHPLDWHISQLKKLEKEIKKIQWKFDEDGRWSYDEHNGYDIAISDVLDLLTKFTK